MIWLARQMQGAVSLEWLIAHPDWRARIEIAVAAWNEAEAEISARASEAPPA